MGTKAEGQLGMDEKVVVNADLEAALEARFDTRVRVAEARHDADEADEKAQAMLVEMNLQVGDVIRVGRFRIERTASPARSVSFETEAKERTKIDAVQE